jgi:hypothetical protein
MKVRFQIGAAILVLFKNFLLFCTSIRILKSKGFLISDFRIIKKGKEVKVLERREYTDEDEPR